MARETRVIDTILDREPSGERQSSELALPVDATTIIVTCTRSDLTLVSGEALLVVADLSLDNGATWSQWIGFSTTGGDILRDTVLQAESWAQRDLPEPENTRRRVRTRFRNFSTLSTVISITTE